MGLWLNQRQLPKITDLCFIVCFITVRPEASFSDTPLLLVLTDSTMQGMQELCSMSNFIVFFWCFFFCTSLMHFFLFVHFLRWFKVTGFHPPPFLNRRNIYFNEIKGKGKKLWNPQLGESRYKDPWRRYTSKLLIKGRFVQTPCRRCDECVQIQYVFCANAQIYNIVLLHLF